MEVATRTRLFVAALVLMWLATIAHEPGGLAAFADQLLEAQREVQVGFQHVEHRLAEAHAREEAETERLCEWAASTGTIVDVCRGAPTELDYLE